MTTQSLTDKSIPYTQTKSTSRNDAHWENHKILCPSSDPALVVAYKILRTRLLQRCNQNGWQSIGITSAGQGEGKSLTAINLAISLAQEFNHTVMLVDLDLANPSICKYLDITPQKTLLDYLQGDVELSATLINPGITGLVVLPATGDTAHSSEILSTPVVVRMAEELKSRYPNRIVLYDLPATMKADDALLFSPCIDAYLLVVKAGETRLEQVRQTTTLLQQTPCIGTVLNFNDEI